MQVITACSGINWQGLPLNSRPSAGRKTGTSSRPELRFDHAYSVPAYNNGTKQNQFPFAMDLIVRY